MIPAPITDRARKLLFFAILVPSLIIAVTAVFAFRVERQLDESFKWVTHTLAVESAIQHLLVSIVDAETSQRGYLLTDRETYLEPYEISKANVPNQLSALHALTVENPTQQERLKKLDPLVADKLAFVGEIIDMQRNGEHNAAVEIVHNGRGKITMEAIRDVLGGMESEEQKLLFARQEHLSHRTRQKAILLTALVALNALFAGTGLILLYSLLHARGLVTTAAWSHIVQYEGEWLTLEQYLEHRFNISTNHGLAPAEADKIFGSLKERESGEVSR
jgi:CHASE3 domain sensor protein